MPQAATGLRTRRIRQRVQQRRVGLSTLRDAAATFRPTTLLLLAIWLGLVNGIHRAGRLRPALAVRRPNSIERTAIKPACALDGSAFPCHGLRNVRVVLALVARLIRAAGWSSRGSMAFVFLSAFALLFTYRGLSSIAQAVLAGGIALRFTGWVLFRSSGVRRLIFCSIPVMIGLVATFYAIGPSRERVSERRLPSRRRRVRRTSCSSCSTRFERRAWASTATSVKPRRSLSRLAQRGVRFDQARAAAAWTLPSHASMFTGRWAHELSTRLDRPLDETYPTLAEYLGDHGYETAGFVANTFFCSRWFGLSRGFLHYEDVALNPVEILRSSNLGRALARKIAPYHRDRPTAYFDRKDGSTINGEFLDWLDDGGRGIRSSRS